MIYPLSVISFFRSCSLIKLMFFLSSINLFISNLNIFKSNGYCCYYMQSHIPYTTLFKSINSYILNSNYYISNISLFYFNLFHIFSKLSSNLYDYFFKSLIYNYFYTNS